MPNEWRLKEYEGNYPLSFGVAVGRAVPPVRCGARYNPLVLRPTPPDRMRFPFSPLGKCAAFTLQPALYEHRPCEEVYGHIATSPRSALTIAPTIFWTARRRLAVQAVVQTTQHHGTAARGSGEIGWRSAKC